MEENQIKETPNARTMMLNALRNIGCQPREEDEGEIIVRYQGEEFVISCGDMFVRIWDPKWVAIKADDPRLPIFREAINKSNFDFRPTIVYSSPNEENLILVHTRRDIMLHPTLPDTDDYVLSVLDSFFDAKKQMGLNYKYLASKQQEEQGPRRTIGFDTNSTSESATDSTAEQAADL